METNTIDNLPLTREGAPILYDADAPQRIPAHFAVDGEEYSIVLVAAPVLDTHLMSYAKQCTRADDELDTTATLDAAVWLFDAVITDVEGIGEEGEEKPGDWRDFFSPQEKAAVVNNAILACYPVEPPTEKTDKRLSWKMQTRVAKTTLRAFFDGREIETTHVLRKADAKTLSEFATIMGRVFTPKSGGDARMGELAALYDRLHESHEGYAGRVPLHHKSAALIGHLARQSMALRKN